MTTNYMGNEPFAGLTLLQERTIEAATKLAPPASHDGLWRNIAAALSEAESWSDDQINSAILSVMRSSSGLNIWQLGFAPFASIGSPNLLNPVASLFSSGNPAFGVPTLTVN